MKIYIVVRDDEETLCEKRAWATRDEAQSVADRRNESGATRYPDRVLELEYMGPSLRPADSSQWREIRGHQK